MHFHINVDGDDAEQEADIIRSIASGLICAGVKKVTMIIDGEQTVYDENGAHTTKSVLRTLLENDPRGQLAPSGVIQGNKCS